MFTYVSFNEFGKERIKKLAEIWNNEFGFIFPITPELLYRNTYGTFGFMAEHSFIVLEENNPVGYVINKVWQNTEYSENYEGIGWISLIYVQRDKRCLGIGSELLKLSLDTFKSLGIQRVQLGKDYQNFFPGLPKDFKEHLGWFQKRGFESPGETNDLIHYVSNVDKFQFKPYKDGKNYEIRFMNKNDCASLVSFMRKNFPGRWVIELLDYLDHNDNLKEFLICLDEGNNICGFCRVGHPTTPTNKIGFSLTWRDRFKKLGGIGPLGVDSEYRKNNIAYNLIIYALNYLKEEGCTEMIIDWTNILSFYRQFGFEIWKTYYYIERKNLKTEDK